MIGDITSYRYKVGYDLAAIGDGGADPETGYTLWVDGIFAKRKPVPATS